MMSAEPSRALEVPTDAGEPLRTLAWTAILAVFVGLAVSNLLDGTALIASWLWLAVVAFFVFCAMAEAGGVGAMMVAWLGGSASIRIVAVSNACPPQNRRPRSRCERQESVLVMETTQDWAGGDYTATAD